MRLKNCVRRCADSSDALSASGATGWGAGLRVGARLAGAALCVEERLNGHFASLRGFPLRESGRPSREGWLFHKQKGGNHRPASSFAASCVATPVRAWRKAPCGAVMGARAPTLDSDRTACSMACDAQRRRACLGRRQSGFGGSCTRYDTPSEVGDCLETAGIGPRPMPIARRSPRARRQRTRSARSRTRRRASPRRRSRSHRLAAPWSPASSRVCAVPVM